MKLARFVILTAMLAVFGGATKAQTDPAIGVKGDGDAAPWTGSTSFTVNCGIGPITCDTFGSQTFVLGSDDQPLTSFLFTFGTPQGDFSALADNPICPNVQTIVPGLEALLSGCTILPPSDCSECAFSDSSNTLSGDFFFELDGVINGTTVGIVSNTPEPGTMILLGSGLSAIGVRRLRRRRAVTPIS
jgi:PEP-CTERM motif